MPRGLPDIFRPEFRAEPWWWEATAPTEGGSAEPGRRTDVAVVGGGYAGLAAALDLARGGADVSVFEAAAFSSGASMRNGGAVSGGSTLGRSFSGGSEGRGPDRRATAHLAEDSDALSLVETLIEREGIACHYERSGRFVGAYVPKHYAELERKVEGLNTVTDAGASMVPPSRQREEIGSGYYFGGMVVERMGKLHPALYHRGLLDAARAAGARLIARTPVERIERRDGGFRLATAKGAVTAENVVVATNGYTGAVTPNLRRRLVPVASHIIATEELPEELARGLSPRGRTLSDTPRILCYFRLSPDGRRMLFGGRARFTQAGPEISAPVLHRFMRERFPELAEARVTHAWTGNVAFAFDRLPHAGKLDGLHYCLACNGSGIAIMTYLGHCRARRILGGANEPASAFEADAFPTRPFYRGDPWFLPPVGSYYRARDRLQGARPARSLARAVTYQQSAKARMRHAVVSGPRTTHGGVPSVAGRAEHPCV